MPRRTKKTKPAVHNFKAPLRSCVYEHLTRQIGVRVDEPFNHTGLDKRMVDIWCEYPTVNTNETAKMVPTDEPTEVVQQVMQSLIRCRDKCVEISDELDEHIERLDKAILKVKLDGLED